MTNKQISLLLLIISIVGMLLIMTICEINRVTQIDERLQTIEKIVILMYEKGPYPK